MKFTPKENDLIEKGEYQFKVITANDTASKAGADMIKMQLAIYKNNQQIGSVFDYLLESMMFKLRHFCQCNNLIDKFNSGELTSVDCENVVGWCRVDIQKDKNGSYADQNSIKDYIDKPVNIESKDEDIPF